ncbi:MAG: TAXI family TRAP transporter solute-binding subunit [Rhodospirillaceae bacterium]|jgi:uncharacterized protein|nr:TAXI family TRAP transporter solute-binding subunit [Rhodospirillaceae bacterium]
MLQLLKTPMRVLPAALLIAGISLLGTTQLSAAEFKWPKYFNVIAPTVGTANHSLDVAWTSEFSAKTGVRVRVLPTPNGYARTTWLNSNQGKLSLYQPSDYFAQMEGIEGYASRVAGPSDTRVMYVNLVTPWGYMVRGDSKIKSIKDIKSSTKVAFYSGSSFISTGAKAVLAYAGVKLSDATKVEVGSYPANTAIIVEGRADVAFTSPISGTSYKAEAGPNGIRWLGINRGDSGFAAYRKLQAGYVPTKTVSGPKSAIGIVMDHAFQTQHVRASESADFVYNLTKWLDQNHDTFKGKFVHAKMMTVKNLVAYLDQGMLEPLHEGTIKYLKEKGVWKASYQARQDKILTIVNKRIAIFQDALDAADKLNTTKGQKLYRKIYTVPDNKNWQAFWKDYKKQRGLTKTFGEEIAAIK